MTNDRYDDGLVHSHRWAVEPPPHERRRETHQAPRSGQSAENYDDGLVHSHGWACGERGRPASR